MSLGFGNPKVIMMALVTLVLAAPCAAVKPVRVGGSEYPISTFTQDGQIVGLDYEIVEAALHEAGINSTERVIAPWNRVMAELDHGEVDMVVPMVWSKERGEKYSLSPSIRTRYNIILMKKSAARAINNVGDLTGLRVGKCTGYVYQEEFESAVKAGVIYEEPCVDNEMGIQKLRAGRMDALMIGEDAAIDLIGKLKLSGDFIRASYRSEKASHVGMLKSNDDLYSKFQSGLERARKKGIIEQIIKKWSKAYIDPMDASKK